LSIFFPYIGGKHQLAPRIVEKLPGHRLYCEVFGGSGAVLLAKDPSEDEVFNDINGEISNLFRIVKYHYDEFVKEIRWYSWDRNLFNAFKLTSLAGLTDIQRAARYYYLMRVCYGGRNPHNSLFAGGGVGSFSV